jgi:hypothetical protein
VLGHDLGRGGGAGLSETDLQRLHEGNPSLVPDEKSGFCQKYTGSVCSKYIGTFHLLVVIPSYHIQVLIQKIGP